MTSNYRDQVQFPTSEEEETTSSSPSSSGDEAQVVLGVLSSPSSDYLVQSFIGEGVFGKVAKCLKAATKETGAVKIIMNSNFAPQAKNEVAILEELRAFDSDRFNFVRCNNAFVDREHICIEFEMLDMSLMDFLANKPSHSLTVKEIRPILHQMATALQLLRSLGVVHTDLKLDNIMMVDHVNQPLKIKMIDFGLARHVSQTEWGSYMQPLYYRSPEVILGLPFTAAIDMWSLGCIAAELFLGHALYPGSCEYDMLRHIVRTQGQLPQQLLNRGVKTRCFFRRNRCRERRWRLKTALEYGQVTCTKSYFKSLDDLKKIRPACHLSNEDTMAEIKDRDNFMDLLKKMLYLDVDKRILPSHLIEDPFITMSDLAESYPNSFYVKTCCEVMEVCRDQNLRSYNRGSEVQLVQQPLLNLQASTSTACTTSLEQHSVFHQVSPAWHNCQEHPLVLGIASSVSSYLSIHEDQSPPQPQQLNFSIHKERTPPDLQMSSTSKEAPSYTGNIKPVRKMTRDTFEASLSGERSPEPERKRMEMNSKKVSSEATPSTSKANPQRKRITATFVKQRKNKRMMPHIPRQAPSEGPSNTAADKPARKRTRATLEAAHSGSRNLDSTSPERKKMNPGGAQTHKELLQNYKEAPTEATASTSQAKPQRKRTWATFIASYSGIKRLDTGSPERKKLKMSLYEVKTITGLPQNSKEASTEATSSTDRAKPQRKRTWATFITSHTGIRRYDTGSPERKKKKMSLDEVETQTATLHNSHQASSSKANGSEIGEAPDCSSPKTKTGRKGRGRSKSVDWLRTRRKVYQMQKPSVTLRRSW